MTPRGVAAEETVRFLEAFLPAGARVLEVGSGDGEVALRLERRGVRVRAIDTDAAAVEGARSRGVDARRADFLTYEDDPFDAVLFTRSLHHIRPIGAAAARADSLLVAGGLLIAEEFARETADRETARWFYDLAAALEAAGKLEPSDSISSSHMDPLERWREDHLHEPLNTGEEMRRAVESRFAIVSLEETPYLYRHFSGRLPESSVGTKLVRLLFEWEKIRIANGSLRPTGLRIVAQGSTEHCLGRRKITHG